MLAFILFLSLIGTLFIYVKRILAILNKFKI
jgi:hypothetical protein